MNSLAEVTEIFSKSASEYLKARRQGNRSRYYFGTHCEIYKSILDSNFSGGFCVGKHCKTIFMVVIKYDGSDWGATPKVFYSEKEAKLEVEMLRQKYPFISELRVVERKEKEKD